jgi:DNA invertase Pin-like site-specific DNA recombinase
VDEQETGADDGRPKLKEAIEIARQTADTTILIAKLDRIGRSLPLLYMLIAANISFVAADNPTCDIFSAKIMMLMAERERELIGARTRAGLAVAKSRGVKLGAPYKSAVASLAIGRRAIQERKRAFAVDALRKIREIESTGISSKYKVCQYLNLRGEKTAFGKPWTITAIRRVEAAAK